MFQLLPKRVFQRFVRLPNITTTHLLSVATNQCRSATTRNGEIAFADEKLQRYLETLRQEFYALRVSATGGNAANLRMNKLNGIVKALEQHRALRGNLASEEDLQNEKDEDMRKLIEEENEVYSGLIGKMEHEIIAYLMALADDENYPALIFEINAGAGGQEAMLFASELLEMYTNFFESNGWDYDMLEHDNTDIGGLRHANVMVNDPEAYHYLRYEAGVHRVQRVPATEKSGRIHTSTASVTVIPRPADVHVTLAEKDLKIETKRASGAGGQHVNTTDSAVRIVHLPTGVAVESQSERSQIKNREIAMKRLHGRLLQQQLESVLANTKATRKAQQGNLDRNEKIRTYNFVQDRITDHRLSGGTVHNLPGFLEGGQQLADLMERLIEQNQRKQLAELIESYCDENGQPAEKAKKKQKS